MLVCGVANRGRRFKADVDDMKTPNCRVSNDHSKRKGVWAGWSGVDGLDASLTDIASNVTIYQQLTSPPTYYTSYQPSCLLNPTPNRPDQK
eukprot:gene2007-5082_t